MDTSSNPGANFLDPTYDHALRIWWAFFWRAILLTFGLGIVIGFVLGILGTIAQVPRSTMQIVSGATGLIIGILSSVYVMKAILGKTFRKFAIRLVSTASVVDVGMEPSALP